jgi:hypothetical protein
MSNENKNNKENIEQQTSNKSWLGKVVGLKPNLRAMLPLLLYEFKIDK